MEAIHTKPNYVSKRNAQLYLGNISKEISNDMYKCEISTTEIDKCRLRKERCELQNEYENRYPFSKRGLRNEESELGNESIIRKRVWAVHGDARRAGNSKLKLVHGSRHWTASFGRTISGQVRVTALLGLLLLSLAASSAAPARSRSARSAYHSKSVAYFRNAIWDTKPACRIRLLAVTDGQTVGEEINGLSDEWEAFLPPSSNIP
ncbi:hypothetical protein RR48_12294 [Papilio machaon]|uniref:Uncharacterized protein n=1 Tax=Papilio machaon TaxID=76193 RepID=A0A194QY88_PAPMA|nr:hypothetical protein RR48_12294 [Papilio machaon]